MSVYIDIKTGKSPVWACLQTAAQSMLDSEDVTFDPEGHIYTYHGKVVPSITQILKHEGFIDDRWYDEWSRDKGSAVHLACHLDVMDDLDEGSLDDTTMNYIISFRKFMKETGFYVAKSEVPMVSLKYNFAGTADLIGEFPSPLHASRFVLELYLDNKFRLIPHVEWSDHSVFLGAFASYNWKINHKIGDANGNK